MEIEPNPRDHPLPSPHFVSLFLFLSLSRVLIITRGVNLATVNENCRGLAPLINKADLRAQSARWRKKEVEGEKEGQSCANREQSRDDLNG